MASQTLSGFSTSRGAAQPIAQRPGLAVPEYVPDTLPERRVSNPAEMAAAREDAGLSQQDLANVLRLQVGQIIALELGEFERLPGRAFVRGALRAMARVIDVDASPLLATVGGASASDNVLGQIKPMPAVPVATAGALGNLNHQATGGRGRWRSSALVGAGLGALALVGLAVFGGASQEGSPGGGVSKIVQVPVPGLGRSTSQGQQSGAIAPVKTIFSAAPAGAGATNAQAMRPAIRSNIQALPVTNAPAPATPKRSPAQVAATGLIEKRPLSMDEAAAAKKLVFPVKQPELEVLQLSFTKRTWVDIRHKDGEKLLFGTQKAAKSLTIRGVPPMQVVIGNPNGVKLRFRGELVDLKKRRSRKGVSRFILN